MERRSSRRRHWLPLAAVLALTTAACGGSPLSPDELASLLTTESFSGPLAVGASAVHPFVGKGAGAVTLTMTALAPDNTLLLGLGLGNWDGTTCSVQISTTQGKVGTDYAATISSAGNFCVFVTDVGTLTADVTYTVQVRHP